MYFPKYLLSVIFALLCAFLLASCSTPDTTSPGNDGALTASQQQMLEQLDAMRLQWQQAGVIDYDFALEKECDCPDSQPQSTTLSARSDRSSDNNQNQALIANSFQTNNIESYFGSLRQAILNNQIQQVNYNPQFAYPQSVQFQLNPQSPVITLRINNFRVQQQSPFDNIFTLDGTLSTFQNPANPSGNSFWLTNNLGQFQLNIPPSLLSQLYNYGQNIPVSITGSWAIGNVNGQLSIQVSNITISQQTNNVTTLQGVITYMIGDPGVPGLPGNYAFNLWDGNQNIPLIVPQNLRTIAMQYSGQSVQVNGYYQQTGSVSQRFVVNQISPLQQANQQFTGTLSISGNPCIGCLPQYMLMEDNGSIYQLNIPPTLTAIANALANRRVTVTGNPRVIGPSNIMQIDVSQIYEAPNVITDVFLNVTVLQAVNTPPYDNTMRFSVRSDSGELLTIAIAPAHQSTALFLTPGMRISIAGRWVYNPATGQSEVELVAPPQLLGSDNGTLMTYTGAIVAEDCSYSADKTYYYVTDNGESLQLSVSNSVSTFVVPRARYRVVGYRSGNELLASMVEPIPQAAYMPQPITGVIQSIQSITPLACTQIYAYQFYNDNGQLQTLRVSSAMGQNLLQSLVPGSRVNVSQYHVTQQGMVIDVLNFEPNAQGQNIRLEGAIILPTSCNTGNEANYLFATINGETYTLQVNNALLNGLGFQLNNGISLIVNGTMVSATNIVQVNQIELHPMRTLIPPFARGIFVNQKGIETLGCGESLYIFEFFNDNGFQQQVKVPASFYLANSAFFTPGQRVELTLPTVLGTNDPTIYPTGVRFANFF